MILEDIGEGDDALFCMTNLTACCRDPHTGENGSAVGNWFFPNGTTVSSSDGMRDFYRTREQMVVHLNRKRGGVDGIYRCEITDSINVTQTIYIGVYSASSGTGEDIGCTLSLNFTAVSMYVADEILLTPRHTQFFWQL